MSFKERIMKGVASARESYEKSARERAEVKRVEHESLHEARLKEARSYGAKVAKVEYKKRLSAPSGGGFGSFAGNASQGASAILGGSGKGSAGLGDFLGGGTRSNVGMPSLLGKPRKGGKNPLGGLRL
jgi:hypothetical protein